MNSSDVKGKLASSNSRADLLSRPGKTEEEGISEIYYAAFSRPPTDEEMRIAKEFVLKLRTDSQDKPLDPQRAKRQGYEDLIWAILNTKEFFYNH